MVRPDVRLTGIQFFIGKSSPEYEIHQSLPLTFDVYTQADVCRDDKKLREYLDRTMGDDGERERSLCAFSPRAIRSFFPS